MLLVYCGCTPHLRASHTHGVIVLACWKVSHRGKTSVSGQHALGKLGEVLLLVDHEKILRWKNIARVRT